MTLRASEDYLYNQYAETNRTQ